MTTAGLNKPVGKAPGRRKWSSSAVVTFFVLLVCLPLAGPVFVQFKKEIARWYWAAAISHRKAKRFDEAAQSLELALKYDPQSAKLIFERARLRLLNKHYDEAMADVVDLLEDTDLRAEFRYQVGQIKATILLKQHKVSAGLETLSQMVAEAKKLGGRQYARALNNLAYHRTLANVDIGKAIVDVNKALRLCKESERPAYLDTRGWAYFRAGKYEQALADLQDAIKLFRPIYQSNIEADPDNEEIKKNLAVFLQHRSMAYKALREDDKAAKDRQEIKELCLDPDKDLE